MPPALAQSSFQSLGDLPGGRGSHANAVSADGSVVVGFSYDNSATPHAIRWTQAGGMQIMFPGGFGFDFTSSALCISADGLTIGGWHAPTIIEEKAFIWSAAAGEQLLATRSGVQALSSNGDVGAGYIVSGNGAPQRAAIWDINRNQHHIDSPGVIPTSNARGISADGTIVVGQAVFGSSMIRAFRWTAATGMVNIGSLDFSDFSSHADAITPDGSVIVGAMGGSSVLHPARWTASGGWQYLGTPIGVTGGSAYAVSADGNTVVGAKEGRAFIWRTVGGMEDLQAVLGSAVPAGWTLAEARAISADGLTIVGNGSQVGGAGGAWIATLPCFTVSAVPSAAACSGGSAAFSVTATGTGPFSYQWRFNTTPINANTNPSAATATLALSNVSAADRGSYDCVATNACSTVTSSPAPLTVFIVGSGDGNADGLTDGLDIPGMVHILVSGGPPSTGDCAYDMDASGTVDLGDVLLFVNRLLGP